MWLEDGKIKCRFSKIYFYFGMILREIIDVSLDLGVGVGVGAQNQPTKLAFCGDHMTFFKLWVIICT